MIYRNDNIKIESDYVEGTLEDIMEYFRYELASQCMSGKWLDKENNYENFIDNAKNIIEVIENLEEDLQNKIFTKNDIIRVSEHAMGGFYITCEV